MTVIVQTSKWISEKPMVAGHMDVSLLLDIATTCTLSKVNLKTSSSHVAASRLFVEFLLNIFFIINGQPSVAQASRYRIHIHFATFSYNSRAYHRWCSGFLIVKSKGRSRVTVVSFVKAFVTPYTSCSEILMPRSHVTIVPFSCVYESPPFHPRIFHFFSAFIKVAPVE